MPILRVTLTQWRIRRTLPYRRVFTAAALGLVYGTASVTFHRIAPALTGRPVLHPGPRVAAWVLAVILCGLLTTVINKILVMTAIKGADRSVTVRGELLTRRALLADAAELMLAVVIAYVITGAPFLALFAVPCGAMFEGTRRESQLVGTARIDGRTGLLHAAAWQREAAVRMHQATRRDMPLFIALVQVDDLAAAESAGPAARGELLGRVARILRELLPGRLVGGFGDDQFAVLLEGPDAEQAREICARIRNEIASRAFEIEEAGMYVFRLTVSIGGAAGPEPGGMPELIRAAQDALAEARSGGWNHVQVRAGIPAAQPSA